ncbi:ABC transporter permease subunit, partial [Bowdeniella nasicola]|uniref:ABC transporter permease subunit n=1 Tax=Bowdeniella nasicola TaxID=208480 RepID=UPI00116131CE
DHDRYRHARTSKLKPQTRGKRRYTTTRDLTLPHVTPQLIVGFLLLFPHVVLHESGLSFLGFGLPPQTPAIGIILSEGLNNVSAGHWWLVLMPTLVLILLAKSFDDVGERLRRRSNPATAHV